MAALAIGVLFFIAAFFSLMTASTIYDANSATAAQKTAFLAEQARNIASWYRFNIFTIDANAGQVMPPGVSNQWVLTLLASNRVNCNGQTYAHRYALVLPGSSGIATTMDVTTGNVTAGASDQVQIVDGCRIGASMVRASQNKAATLAGTLENYFKGRELQYGPQGNFFTNPSCGGMGEIQCATNAGAQILQPVLGVGALDCQDAYGNNMIFDNSSPAVNSTTPPYTARIGFNTPWGVTIWTEAITTRN
ncbi:MAG: hypothetical protein HQL09_09770 [Nitrospirae bacterium]|nr:hypothetical protein [Nitrospirota bacterium]